MKTRLSLLVFTVIFSLLLAACGSTATATSSGMPAQNSPDATLTSEAELAIGTLKLDGTTQDLTAAQATELLTLWQAYQVLSNSDTTAQAELDALVKQIQETMTSEQLKAIDEMQITAETMAAVMQSAMPEITESASGTAESSSLGQSAAGGGPGTDGGGGPGGAPMDGGGMGGDMGAAMGDPNMSSQSTPDAASQGFAQTANVNPMLLNALIRMLETKAQAAAE